jgi:hypothetical protein
MKIFVFFLLSHFIYIVRPNKANQEEIEARDDVTCSLAILAFLLSFIISSS